MEVVVVDVGVSNIASMCSTLKSLGATAKLTTDAAVSMIARDACPHCVRTVDLRFDLKHALPALPDYLHTVDHRIGTASGSAWSRGLWSWSRVTQGKWPV